MMAYGHTIKKRNNKSRAKTRQMEPRFVLASLAMAAGIFASPFGVGEAAISRRDGTVLFGMESTDVIIRQQNAPDAEIVVE